MIAEIRIALQQPVSRLAIILGCVTALTPLTALLFETHRLRSFYGQGAATRRARS